MNMLRMCLVLLTVLLFGSACSSSVGNRDRTSTLGSNSALQNSGSSIVMEASTERRLPQRVGSILAKPVGSTRVFSDGTVHYFGTVSFRAYGVQVRGQIQSFTYSNGRYYLNIGKGPKYSGDIVGNFRHPQIMLSEISVADQ